jgi:hypothetical protein
MDIFSSNLSTIEILLIGILKNKVQRKENLMNKNLID